MGTEIERKLASIQKIEEIRDIENADLIQAYRILGWWVVDRKNAYKVGDLVVYFEIDSWVPYELAPFLSKGKEPKEYNFVKGERLRTIRLRGQLSQGMILSIDHCFAYATLKKNIHKCMNDGYIHFEGFEPICKWKIGTNLTEILDIQKYEQPIPAQLRGQIEGDFPTSILQKTDQERIQNCFKEIQNQKDCTYEVTLKLDGSSCTIFRLEGKIRVCSRNLELKMNEENKENIFVQTALKLQDKIPEGFAIQGELLGPGIQKNRENLKQHTFFIFDVFNIQEQKYLLPYERRVFVEKLGLKYVPVIFEEALPPSSVEEALKLAEGPSLCHHIREGLVWKCNEKTFSFKTINNTYLLGESK
jgi:hypothetical protein